MLQVIKNFKKTSIISFKTTSITGPEYFTLRTAFGRTAPPILGLFFGKKFPKFSFYEVKSQDRLPSLMKKMINQALASILIL